MPTPSPRSCRICGTNFTPSRKHTITLCSNRCRREARVRSSGIKPLEKVIVDNQKKCSKCQEWKELSEFALRVNRSTGVQSACRECLAKQARKYGKSDGGRHNRYMVRFGVTLQWYEEQLERQGGCCAICLRPERADGRANLAIDHCHKTGKVRGLLCWKCNSGLGQFEDDSHSLRRAIIYLESSTLEPCANVRQAS